MARIRKIHDIINGKLPSYNSAFVKVRGLAFPLDIFLKGRTRFSRKLGANLSVWIPDNATTLSKALSTTQSKVELTLPIPWVIPGSKISINNQLFLFVEDVLDDGYSLLLTEKPLVNSPADAPLDLYGHPLEITGTYAGSPDSPVGNVDSIFPTPPYIVVKSDHKIYLTDEINVGSFNYRVTSSILDPTTLPDGRFKYTLQVSPGIPEVLEDGRQDQAYLRAHPAYESPLLTVPTLNNTIINSIGPFLYDRVSGPFFTDMTVEETDVISTYDNSNTLLNNFILEKNDLLIDISISADSFLFWDKVRGKIQWDGNKQAFKAITDTEGVSHIHYKCVPNIKPGIVTNWSTLIETTAPTTMVVELEPNLRQEFTLAANAKTSITIQFPETDLPIEHIHVLFSTETPNSEVYMRSWQMDTPTVGAISHVTVAKVSGTAVWASSGVMAKPYFLRLDYIKAQVDLLAKLDAGLLVL